MKISRKHLAFGIFFRYELSMLINSSPVMVSFWYKYCASLSSFSLFSVIICFAFSCCFLQKRQPDGLSFSPFRQNNTKDESPPKYWFVTVSSATIPKSSLIPYRVIMARANFVACSISFDAPVLTEPIAISSAARPPV